VKVAALLESPVPASVVPVAPLVAVPLDPLSMELIPLDVPLPDEVVPLDVPLPNELVPPDVPLPDELPLDFPLPDELVPLASAPPEALLPEAHPYALEPAVLLSPAHAMRVALAATKSQRARWEGSCLCIRPTH
jgi:hypothetical protein